MNVMAEILARASISVRSRESGNAALGPRFCGDEPKAGNWEI